MSAASCRKRSGRALAWSGPAPFVPVRQQQHERRPLPPLAARRHDELVDHRLRAVDEVAVLRFPDDEPRRLLHVVAVLEADRRVLRERAVVDLERRRGLRQRLQRHVHPRRCFTSWNTAWRWLNVPRSTSSPVSRMLVPSARIEANASSSADAQSIDRLVRLRRTASRASRGARSSLRWIANPSGSAQQRRVQLARARAAAPSCPRARPRPPAVRAAAVRPDPAPASATSIACWSSARYLRFSASGTSAPGSTPRSTSVCGPDLAEPSDAPRSSGTSPAA